MAGQTAWAFIIAVVLYYGAIFLFLYLLGLLMKWRGW
jgi:hypothetical protein